MSEIILPDCHHDDALGSLIALLVFLGNPPYGAAGQAEEMIEMDMNWHIRLELELIAKKEFYDAATMEREKPHPGGTAIRHGAEVRVVISVTLRNGIEAHGMCSGYFIGSSKSVALGHSQLFEKKKTDTQDDSLFAFEYSEYSPVLHGQQITTPLIASDESSKSVARESVNPPGHRKTTASAESPHKAHCFLAGCSYRYGKFILHWIIKVHHEKSGDPPTR
ncbi:unnamed protein product [Gongylonema pulchrum]|uniref:C2H2-type domain-containing protein n=1 Tax=Gongylonema pulchrum TaxID=637853 RepID=A0A183E1H5_9BILA|nr:unnamed protein product [Gongylonema pulchrum]